MIRMLKILLTPPMMIIWCTGFVIGWIAWLLIGGFVYAKTVMDRTLRTFTR